MLTRSLARTLPKRLVMFRSSSIRAYFSIALVTLICPVMIFLLRCFDGFEQLPEE